MIKRCTTPGVSAIGEPRLVRLSNRSMLRLSVIMHEFAHTRGKAIMLRAVGERRSTTTGTFTRLLVGTAALVLLGTGLWATLSPESFYAAIATYPPFNRHFVHDIGAFQLGLGAGLALALLISDALLVALGANAIAAVAHFISHAIDRDLGGQPSDPLTIGLFALVLLGLTAWRVRTLSRAGW